MFPIQVSGAAMSGSKRARFDAFDVRVVHDKASDRLSVSATLTEIVTITPGVGLEPTTYRLTADYSAIELPRNGLPRTNYPRLR
jgi:hypothetical protein